MSATPLTSRALARLHALVEGNGMEAAAITVARTDESVYTLKAELTLLPRFEIAVATPQEIKRLNAAPLPNIDALRQMAGGRNFPEGWLGAAEAELDDTPARGWGLDGKTLRLDDFTRLFAVTEPCRACEGSGSIGCARCRRTGRMDCDFCDQGGRPTGEDPQNEGRPCRMCNGDKEVTCKTCGGNGRATCSTCRGRGEASTTYALKFYADTRFAWADSGVDLPIALRRAVDRAGLAKLANGHATIVRGDKVEGAVPPRIAFTATLPFATVWFMIDGQKHMAHVLGHKAAILELHDFLDAHVSAAETAGTLQSLRIYNEARLIRARAGGVNDVLRLYPAGLGKEAAAHLLRLAGRDLHQQTRKPRWLTVAAGAGGAALLLGIYSYSGLQVQADAISPLLDALVLLALCAAFVVGQRAALKVIMEKQLGQRNLRPPYFARHVAAGIGAIVLTYLLFLWLNPPTWVQINRLLVMAYWQQWTR